MSGNTPLWSHTKGGLNFPITPPSNSGATPGTLDNTAIGGSTPAPGAFSTLAVGQAGTFTLNGATPVTVAAPGVTANSQVLITLKSANSGTVGAQPHVETITPGTGFTVEGTASDTGIYNYAILN
jgi:hypothetical protein